MTAKIRHYGNARGAERQARYYANQIAKGLKLIKVWVRPVDAQHLRDFAKKLLAKV